MFEQPLASMQPGEDDEGWESASSSGPVFNPRNGVTKKPGTQQAGEPEILDEASELLRPLLRDPTQAPEAAARLVAVAETYKGPIPHPRILSGYDDIVPGAAREILDMAKAEQRHRHRMENRETAYPYLGMGLGGVCLLSCIAGAVFLAWHHDSESVALALIGAPIVTGIGWFINARVALRPVTSGVEEPAAKSGK